MIVRNLIFFAVAQSFFASHALAGANSFSDAQKAEIGQVVREYLVSHPEVLTEAIQALQVKETKEWIQKAKQTVAQNIDDVFNSDSPTNNVKEPKVTIVEFFDYNCPHCKVMTKTLANILSNDKDIRLVYKELPVLNENSLFAAKVALAAREQNKYHEIHQKLMENQEALTQEKVLVIAKELGLDMDKLIKDISSDKVNNELLANRKIAVSLGLKGTPAFIIGKKPATKEMPIEVIPGELNEQNFLKVIKSVK